MSHFIVSYGRKKEKRKKEGNRVYYKDLDEAISSGGIGSDFFLLRDISYTNVKELIERESGH